MSERWRGVVAALLNPDLRAALGELSAGAELTDTRRARALARLEQLGIVRRDDDGIARFDESVIRELLAEDPVVRPRGPERYLDGAGRIDRYPSRSGERRELLAWVTQHALPVGEAMTEADVNERLAPFTDDVAVLRRYLVDHSLIERTRSGSEYRRLTARED